MVKTVRKVSVPSKAGKEELEKLRANISAPAPAAEPKEPAKPADVTPIDQKRETIGYFLTPDGDVDLERMNRASIEKLRQLFQTPAIQKNVLKMPEEVTAAKEPALPPVMIAKMYDAIGMLEVACAVKIFKVDGEIAERVLPFTEKEKALLVPATTVVVDKYSGDWLKKYKDEVFLATMLISVMSAKIVQLRLQLAILAQAKQAASTRPASASAESVPPGAAASPKEENAAA